MELYGAYIIEHNNIIWTYLGNSRIVCQNKLMDKLEKLGHRTVILPEVNGKSDSFNSPVFCQLIKYSLEE